MRFVNVGEERASIRRRWKFHWCSLAMEKMPELRALLLCVNSSDMWRYRLACRSSSHTHVLVRATIIKKPAPSIAHESLHKDDIRYLSDFFPFRPRRKDRKSTRLNSSHPSISYAVFCLKKKNYTNTALYSS